jgi:hypothetical protein
MMPGTEKEHRLPAMTAMKKLLIVGAAAFILLSAGCEDGFYGGGPYGGAY